MEPIWILFLRWWKARREGSGRCIEHRASSLWICHAGDMRCCHHQYILLTLTLLCPHKILRRAAFFENKSGDGRGEVITFSMSIKDQNVHTSTAIYLNSDHPNKGRTPGFAFYGAPCKTGGDSTPQPGFEVLDWRGSYLQQQIVHIVIQRGTVEFPPPPPHRTKPLSAWEKTVVRKC